MVKLKWQYTCDQVDPFIELPCTQAELDDARDRLTSSQFVFWVGDMASVLESEYNAGTHAEIMAGVRELWNV